jgi:hypothetical protein
MGLPCLGLFFLVGFEEFCVDASETPSFFLDRENKEFFYF